MTTNVTRITNACLKYGFVPNNTKQTVNGFTLLPQDYLCPKSYEDGKIYLTENSMTIHHFAGSWVSDVDRYAQELGKKLTFLPEVFVDMWLCSVRMSIVMVLLRLVKNL